MIHTMEEIRKQQQQQDKMAGYLAIPVILIVTILTKLSGQASLGGAVFVGFLSAGPIVSGYYLWKNRGDVAEQYATQLLINEKDLEEDWVGGYSYNQIDLHPDVYRACGTERQQDEPLTPPPLVVPARHSILSAMTLEVSVLLFSASFPIA